MYTIWDERSLLPRKIGCVAKRRSNQPQPQQQIAIAALNQAPPNSRGNRAHLDIIDQLSSYSSFSFQRLSEKIVGQKKRKAKVNIININL